MILELFKQSKTQIVFFTYILFGKKKNTHFLKFSSLFLSKQKIKKSRNNSYASAAELKIEM